jgi:hypothetical protein
LRGAQRSRRSPHGAVTRDRSRSEAEKRHFREILPRFACDLAFRDAKHAGPRGNVLIRARHPF